MQTIHQTEIQRRNEGMNVPGELIVGGMRDGVTCVESKVEPTVGGLSHDRNSIETSSDKIDRRVTANNCEFIKFS